MSRPTFDDPDEALLWDMCRMRRCCWDANPHEDFDQGHRDWTCPQCGKTWRAEAHTEEGWTPASMTPKTLYGFVLLATS